MKKRIGIVAVAAAALACGGGSTPHTGCSSAADCGQGQVCVVSGTVGTCQAPPFGIQLTAPAQGAEVGGGGVEVRATVTKASAGGPAPDSVSMVVDGSDAGAMALEADDGATLRYRGTYTPPANAVHSSIVAAVARTPAGAIVTQGVIVSVDTKPPVIESAVATCGTAAACLRDGTLLVEVSVSDDHPVTITASLDLAGPALPAASTGFSTFYDANLKLAQYAFPSFSGTAQATVVARDSFGNTATAKPNAVQVTRLRWVYDAVTAGTAITGPAVTSSGNVVIGVSNGTANLRAVGPDGKEVWRTAAGTSTITAAPSIGTLVYAASNDGKLYPRDPATGNGLVSCPTPAPAAGALFTPAILGSPETAFTAGAAAGLYGAKPGSAPTCTAAVSTTDPASTSAVISSGGKIFLTTAQARATLRRYPAAGPEEASRATTCGAIAAPLAMDSGGNIVGACSTGEIIAADPATLTASQRVTFSSPALESPVLFPNGDILVGTNDRKLHRLAPPSSGTGTWIDAWLPVPDLGAAVTGAAIVSPDPAGVVAYAVTALGNLHAVDGSGKTVWTTATEVTPPLGAVSLSFPAVAPAASADALPTLYSGSADGKLYAVIVDSGLDTTSPWPKSHHDLRNTGNAAAPLP